MRNALKKGVDFDYTRYLDDPNSGIYDFVNDHVQTNVSSETKDAEEAQVVSEEPVVVEQEEIVENAPIGYEEVSTVA
jgi:hypothetical protein